MEICKKERIDVIYPSRDPDVFVCSKNKGRLKEHGILTPVPELDVLLGVLDKGRTIELAQMAGFPCPETVVGYMGMDISGVQQAFGPPWIIKPRRSLDMEICKKERIDVIYPSRDPDVFVCSKNKGRLKEHGILTPVPELDVLLGVLDKGRTIELAQMAGFPCPETVVGYMGMDISGVQQAFGPPWIIKPRTSAGSTGMAIVTDPAKLQDTIDHVCERYGNPLIQEYIPGSQQVF